MEPLADAGGFLLLRANLARSVEKKETGHHVILYEESCFIDRISLTFHTIV